MIIFGWGKKTVKDLGSMGESNCSRCNNHVELRKIKVTHWFTLYFIPLIPYKKEYFATCPICGNAYPVLKEDGAIVEEFNKYSGKTQTQIDYLKQIEDHDKTTNEE